MIEVISSGLYTSLQDLGRFGQRKYGVPISGAMDRYSAELANRLVGNEMHEAVIEITLSGPILRFNSDLLVSITGADLSPLLDDKPVSMNKALVIPKGSELRFGPPNYGVCCYLAIAGGIKTKKVLDSYSMYAGITQKGKLEKGDTIEMQKSELSSALLHASVRVPKEHFTSKEIELFRGPEFHMLSKNTQKKLKTTTFTISSESNRMAYILNSDLNMSAPEIITAPVQPGTVQLTPSGKLMVLMRDAQTTGGYARILQLSDSAINKIAQKRPNEEVMFRFK
ncbi:MAG: biotin-dependent carboxyltransferase family protein [Aureisphaera sp.]